MLTLERLTKIQYTVLVKNVAVEVENYTWYWISFNATYKAYGEIHSITKIK